LVPLAEQRLSDSRGCDKYTKSTTAHTNTNFRFV